MNDVKDIWHTYASPRAKFVAAAIDEGGGIVAYTCYRPRTKEMLFLVESVFTKHATPPEQHLLFTRKALKALKGHERNTWCHEVKLLPVPDTFTTKPYKP